VARRAIWNRFLIMTQLATMTTRLLRMCPLLALVACAGGEKAADPLPEPPEVVYGSVKARDTSGKANGADFTAVINGQNAFALRLLAALREAEPTRNLAVSGYSINQVMGMLYAGAAGATAEDIKKVLGWQMPPAQLHAAMNALDLELRSRRGDVTLNIANRVWAQKGLPLLPAFLDVLTRDYGAPLAVADFAGASEAARAAINDWVSRSTESKIKELFPAGSINGNTILALVNALYLDAPWKYKFDPMQTRQAPFQRLDGTTAMVDMMHYDEFLPSASNQEWSAVEIPYKGDELSMVVIVPEDLRRFETRLTPELLGEVLGAIKEGGIHLSFPKVNFSFHASLRKTLEGLGLASLFTGADLSGITGSAGPSVESFEHEVFLDVDENGTKAAAATGAAIADSHGPTVSVDRPFIFAIRDKPTGALLFLGRVVDPGAH
jgi:serpin B